MTAQSKATNSHRNARQQYEELVASIDGIVWEADARTFQFTFVSQQAERLLGYPLEQWQQPGFWVDHLHPEDRAWVAERCRKATVEKRRHDFDCRMIAADGGIVWLRDIVNVVVEGGEVTRLRGVMVDHTERKRIEEALRESEELYRLLTENAIDMIYLLDLDGRTVYASPSVVRLLGSDPTQLVNVSQFDRIHPEDLEAAQRAWEQVVAGEPVFITFRFLHPNGSCRWLEAWASRVQYRGRPHVMGISRDITERQQAENALRESEERFRAFMDHSPAAGWIVDREGRIHYLSPGYFRMFGLDEEDYTGRTVGELWEPDLAQLYIESNLRMLRERRPLETVEPARRRDGSLGEFLVVKFPITMPGGEVLVGGVALDITDQKRAEEALRVSYNLLHAVFEATPEIVFVKDLQGRVLMINSAGARLLGRSREEILGRDDTALLPPKAAWAIMRDDWRIMSSGVPETFEEQVTINGTTHTYLTTKDVYRDGQGNVVGLIGIARDMTERKRIEEALRRNEAYLAEAQRLGRTGSWAWDVATREFVHWSQAHYRLHGLDPQRGTPSWEAAQQLIHPDDRARCLEQIERAVQGRTDCELEYRTVLADGTVKDIHSISHPVFNEAGELVEFIGTEQDITERKRAEEQLRASLREKEALLKEVHHRVKNNLQLISSLLSLQAARVKDRSARQALADSYDRVRSLAVIHEDLYRAGQFAQVPLAAQVKNLCAHLLRSYGGDSPRVELQTRIADVPLDLERAVPLVLIINELVSNALKHAFPEGCHGRVLVELQAATPGQYALTVADDGVGLPAEIDPACTGSLGLQLVSDLAQQLRGTVAVRRDGGTTFTISFDPVFGGERP